MSDQSLYPTSELVGRDFRVGLAPAGRCCSQAQDVNDADDVVGTSEHFGSETFSAGGRATIWRAANNWRPESPNFRADLAFGITESGQVVGYGRDGVYVWQNGRYTVLQDALADDGWTIIQVEAVSHTRMIAAAAKNRSGIFGVVLIDIGSAP